jgi:hypothetical protein
MRQLTCIRTEHKRDSRASNVFLPYRVRSKAARLRGWKVWICQTPDPDMRPVQLPFHRKYHT